MSPTPGAREKLDRLERSWFHRHLWWMNIVMDLGIIGILSLTALREGGFFWAAPAVWLAALGLHLWATYYQFKTWQIKRRGRKDKAV